MANTRDSGTRLPEGNLLPALRFPHVLLTPQDIDRADALARRRNDRAVRGNYKPGNNAPRRGNVDFNIHGARGELAGKYYCDPVEWLEEGGFGVPDLAGFIDVKTSPYPQGRLAVQPQHLHDDWAYLFVESSAAPLMRIVGWAWGAEVRKHGKVEDLQPGRPAHCLKQDSGFLRWPWDLLAELNRRGL